VSNDTLVPPIDPDERDCDLMVDDLSQPDFVRRHLSVELQNLLACYDYDDDDGSDQSSVDKFTMDDPDPESESGVHNSIADENMPGVVPPSISVSLNNSPSLDDLAYQPKSTKPWYQRTVKKMGLNPLEDLLMPWALYHDFTGVDVYQKHSLGPWMIVLLLPKTDVREKSSSWRHMFMIPDVGKGGKGLSSEEKNRLYHEGLRIGLEQLVSLQQNPPTMDVRVGGFKKRMRVHFVSSLILGDQESSDKICA
jgi:hypothetical protein